MMKGWSSWLPAVWGERMNPLANQAPDPVYLFRHKALEEGIISAMNNTIDVTMLSYAELVDRERLALRAWIDASATSAAARARYRVAVQAQLDRSAAHEALRAAQTAERDARTAH